MTRCKLCREEKDLCDSHIIPEFFYRPGYDDKGRALKIDRRTPSEPFVQSGAKQPLLCADCEQFLNDSYERDFARYWYHTTDRPEVVRDEWMAIQGYDYDTFKLHHLSVLWRASVAGGDFKGVNLGPHEEPIREMILEKNPGPWMKYPMSGVVLVLSGNADEGIREGEVADGAVMMPARMGNWNSHTQYQTVFGGVLWTYLISSHTDGMGRIRDALITPDEKTLFPVMPFTKPDVVSGVIQDHLEKREEAGQDLRDWP